jgi:hypothetical protein
MLRSFTKSFLVFFSLTIFLSTALHAQQKALVSISADTLVELGNEKLLSLSVKVSNSSASTFEGFISPVLPQGYKKVGEPLLKVKIAAGAHSYFPIKFLVLNSANAGDAKIVFNLMGLEARLLASSSATVNLPLVRATALVVSTPSILLKSVGDSIILKVMVRNAGNQVEDLKLVAAFPGGEGESKQIIEQNLLLIPGSEKEIHFSKVITKQIYQLSSFYINVAGLYKNGNLFGNGVAFVQNAAGERQFVSSGQDRTLNLLGGTNQVSLIGQNLFSDSQSWQLTGGGTTQVGNGLLAFNVDAYQWQNLSNQPLITNTWLNYETKNYGATVGNITENLESFINGRGVKVYTKKEESKEGLEFGAVEKSFNLLGSNFDYGYAAYARLNAGNGGAGSVASSMIFDYSPLDETRSVLTSNTVTLFNRQKFSLNATAGGGLSQNLNDISDIKPSLSLGANMNGAIGKFSFTSNNFYSSAYYPGIRRGVMQFNERIARYFGKQYLWVGFNYYSFDPQYQRGFSFIQRDYALQRLELGWARPIGQLANFTLTLSNDQEKASYNFLGYAKGSLNAIRLNESINWHSRNFKQNIFLSLENGFANYSSKNNFQLRMNANWSHPWFNLNVFYQRGSFLIAETFQGNPQEDISRFSISPSFRHTILKGKLKLEAGIIFYRDGFFGNNTTYTARSEFQISQKSSFYIGSYQYQYSNMLTRSTFRSLQAGITQKLPTPKQHITGKKGDMEILFFIDENQNEIFDAGEIPAKNVNVLINRTLFVVPVDGKIKYNKVPYGSYVINMPLQNGYQIDPQTVTIDQKKTILAIPLQRNGNVAGMVNVLYEENKSVETVISLAEINVSFVNDKGIIRSVKTGEKGDYSINLPLGNYKVYPESKNLPLNTAYVLPPKSITVSNGQTTKVETITLKVKERKVEIKRFKN